MQKKWKSLIHICAFVGLLYWGYGQTDSRIWAAALPEPADATPATATVLATSVTTETVNPTNSATATLTVAPSEALLPPVNPAAVPFSDTLIANQGTPFAYMLALPVVVVPSAQLLSPTDPIHVSTESVQTVAVSGIWLSPAEIAVLPTTGPAWLQLKAAADIAAAAPTLSNQDTDANVNYLAKALVFARTGDAGYRAEIVAALRTIATGNTEEGGRTLALGRELVAYVIAADLVDLKSYDATLDAQFRTKLRTLLTKRVEGLTLQETHEKRPNNWGSHAGASRAAIALYLGDRAELDRTWLVFRGYLGDRAAYSGFEYGDLDWQADALAPVPINPVGAMKQGYSLDGALPEEMRRGGDFQWPPLYTGYAWEALQGAVVQAQILQRAGYPAWAWQDRALLRAALFLKTIGWSADGDDGWQPWLINHAYGTEILPAVNPAEPGKNMGWTNWTHMAQAVSPTATPTETAEPPTATPTNTPVPPTATATPIPPTATNTPVPPPTRTPGNQAPLVNAGVDQRITFPINSVSLSGSATDDNLPNPPAMLSFAWSKVSGPGTVTLGSANATNTIASFSTSGVYVLRLIVSDGALSASDDLEIIVASGTTPTATPVATATNTPVLPTATPIHTPLPPTATSTATPPPPTATVTPPASITPASLNRAPSAHAGADQSIILPANLNLTGSANDDGLPNPPAALSYTWSKVSGPGAVSFTNTNALQATANFTVAGVYLLRLIVTDGDFSASDDLQVVVNRARPTHQAPVVDAGTDQSIVWPSNSISLTGSATDDGLPNPPAALHYAWSKVSGSGTVNFGSVNVPNSTTTFSQAGLYILRLIVSDSELSASDDVQIMVNPSLPTSLTFVPTDDSGLTSGSATGTLGSALTYRVRSGSPEYRIYLKFDVTGLSRPVQSAKLRLYVTDGSDSGGAFYPVANNLFNSSVAWSERNLTWSTAPLITSTPLHTLGAVSLGTWVEVDVTLAVMGNGTYSFGVKTTSTDSAYYSSKEGKNQPQLLITMADNN